MDDSRLRRWELKRHFRETSACYSLEIEMDGSSQQLQVEAKNEVAHLNEAHVLVRKSTIKGAQRGLFIRQGNFRQEQTKPSAHNRRNQTKKLIQALRLITSLKLSDREEYFTIKLPNMTAQNIGRFINQGGLSITVSEKKKCSAGSMTEHVMSEGSKQFQHPSPPLRRL